MRIVSTKDCSGMKVGNATSAACVSVRASRFGRKSIGETGERAGEEFSRSRDIVNDGLEGIGKPLIALARLRSYRGSYIYTR